MAGADGLRSSESNEGEPQRRQHGRGAAGAGGQLGRRGDAAVDSLPGPGQRGGVCGGHRRTAATAGPGLGGDGDHRTGIRLRLGGGVHHRQAGRRRVRDQRREDLRHRRFAGHPHRGVGDAGQVQGPRGDQVVHRAARAPRRHRRAAGEQARDQGFRHRRHPVRERPHTEGQSAGQPRNRAGQRLFRGDGDLRQHPAGGGGHGDRDRPRHPGRAAQDPDRRRRGDLLRQALTGAKRRGGRVPADGGRLGVQLPADAARGVAGRQQDPQLQRSVDVQGQGRPGGQRHHPQSRRIGRHHWLFRDRRCWRSGPATRRSWTSSRAPSRSSSWWSHAACWACRRPS